MTEQKTTSQTFALSDTERQAIEHEMSHYEDPRAASIEALKLVQKERGWVPDGAIAEIATILGIPASDVEGVATFYSQIYRQPVGRHVVKYCDSVVCYINGYQKVQAALENKLKVKPGETTFDGRFTLLPVCCLGNCDKGPSMMVDQDTYEHVSPDELDNILEQYQ